MVVQLANDGILITIGLQLLDGVLEGVLIVLHLLHSETHDLGLRDCRIIQTPVGRESRLHINQLQFLHVVEAANAVTLLPRDGALCALR